MRRLPGVQLDSIARTLKDYKAAMPTRAGDVALTLTLASALRQPNARAFRQVLSTLPLRIVRTAEIDAAGKAGVRTKRQ
jgi:hypothetical protein